MLLTMADTFSLNGTKSHGNKFFAMSITNIARYGKSKFGLMCDEFDRS